MVSTDPDYGNRSCRCPWCSSRREHVRAGRIPPATGLTFWKAWLDGHYTQREQRAAHIAIAAAML